MPYRTVYFGFAFGVEYKALKFKFSTKANRNYKCSVYYESHTDAKRRLGDRLI
jgi:hypothetical protein